MLIKEVKISDFMAIHEAEFSLEDKGLVLIQGENRDDSSQDSNGSGKSSLAEAIAWCLYGVTARGDKTDEVIRKSATKAAVTVTLDDNGELYRIERSRTKSKIVLDVFKHDKSGWTSIAKGTAQETQKLLEQLMGCSSEVFNAAIYAAQERMPDLPGMTDKQLKMLIEEAAGIERIEAAHQEARKRRQAVKDGLSVIELQKDRANVAIDRAELALQHAQKEHVEWEALQALNIQQAREKALASKQVFEALKVDNQTAETEFARLNAERDAIQQGLSQVKAHEAEIKWKSDIARDLERKLFRLEEAQRQALHRLKQESEVLKSATAKPDSDCPACGQKMTDTTRAKHLLEMNQRIQALKTECIDRKGEIEQLENSLKAAQYDLKELEGSRKDVTAEASQLAHIDSEARKHQDTMNQFKRAAEALKRDTEALKRMMEQKNPHEASLKRSQDSLAENRKELEELEAQLTLQEEELRLHDLAVGVFGPSGVRAHILDTVTPFLNQRTAEYLNTLTDGNIGAIWTTLIQNKKGEVKEKFSIDVQSRTGAAAFRSLSGGEKRKVRLACSMALQDLVSSRATKPIKLYIADEIDHALDESGLERLMTILNDKSRERGTVLVISHNSLRDWVDEVALIVKEGGKSRLESGVLNV